MGLEAPTWIDDLNEAWPIGASDPRSQGDDHLRAIKSALKTTFPNATKAFYFPIVTNVSTSPYNLPSTDRNVLLRVDASGGARTINLPAAATMVAGAQVRVSRVAGANTITVDPNGAELINGAATLTVGPTAYDALIIECTGTAWTAYAATTPIPGAGDIDRVVLRTFTSTGTYTPTAGMLYCIAELVGGGGGGGGVDGTSAVAHAAAGGGAGGYARRVLSAADIGASKAVTIGAAGSGGAGGATGGSGGTTSLGALLSATGGAGGFGASGASTSYIVAGGSGGTGTAASGIAVLGNTGGMAVKLSASSRAAGFGGSGPFGIGGRDIITNSAGTVGTAGNAGTGKGSGGGGAICSNLVEVRTGGAGTAGVVYITEFVAT